MRFWCFPPVFPPARSTPFWGRGGWSNWPRQPQPARRGTPTTSLPSLARRRRVAGRTGVGRTRSLLHRLPTSVARGFMELLFSRKNAQSALELATADFIASRAAARATPTHGLPSRASRGDAARGATQLEHVGLFFSNVSGPWVLREPMAQAPQRRERRRMVGGMRWLAEGNACNRLLHYDRQHAPPTTRPA